MSPPIDDRYFEWLYNQFLAVRNRNPARTYWKLARQLHSTEFVWLIANDDNRVEDGKNLRDDFIHEQGSDGVTDLWMTLGCSVLEMLLALSMRAEYQNGVTFPNWMEEFFKNLDIHQYNDKAYNKNAEMMIAGILDSFIYRNYRHDGSGGLFPLKNPEKDQTKEELWYQMMAYILENE